MDVFSGGKEPGQKAVANAASAGGGDAAADDTKESVKKFFQKK
jgi:hypothetical protein